MLLFIVFYFTRPQCCFVIIISTWCSLCTVKSTKESKKCSPRNSLRSKRFRRFFRLFKAFFAFWHFFALVPSSARSKSEPAENPTETLATLAIPGMNLSFRILPYILTALGSLRNNFVFPMAHFVESKPAALRMKRQLSAGSPVQFC